MAPPVVTPPQRQGLQGFAPDDQARIRTMVKRLADRLAANPDDEQGWRMLARSYGVLGETEKAKEAQAKADALAKQKAQ